MISVYTEKSKCPMKQSLRSIVAEESGFLTLSGKPPRKVHKQLHMAIITKGKVPVGFTFKLAAYKILSECI